MAKVFEKVTTTEHAPFINQTFLDFSQEEHKNAQAAALAQVKGELGQTYPLIIGGKKIQAAQTFASLNPSQPDEIIGNFGRATVEQTREAIQAAATTFETWKRVPAQQRADYLFKAAELMRQRRYYLNAWMIYEVGKSWVEADVETAEAIDFLEFYAREMLRLADVQPITKIEGEDNQLVYIPLGVCAVFRHGISRMQSWRA